MKVLDNNIRKQHNLLREVVREVNITNTFPKPAPPIQYSQFHPRIHPQKKAFVYEKYGSLVKAKMPKLSLAKETFKKKLNEEEGYISLFYNIYQEIDNYPRLEDDEFKEDYEEYYCYQGEMDIDVDEQDEDALIKLVREQSDSRKKEEKKPSFQEDPEIRRMLAQPQVDEIALYQYLQEKTGSQELQNI